MTAAYCVCTWSQLVQQMAHRRCLCRLLMNVDSIIVRELTSRWRWKCTSTTWKIIWFQTGSRTDGSCTRSFDALTVSSFCSAIMRRGDEGLAPSGTTWSQNYENYDLNIIHGSVRWHLHLECQFKKKWEYRRQIFGLPLKDGINIFLYEENFHI